MNIARLLIACKAALALGVCTALTGCLTSSPKWDAHFGEAVTTVRDAQVIDPNAATRQPPTVGIDAKSAAAAMANYDRSFKQPLQSSNPFVIGIGGGGTTSAAPSGQ
jgi:hypothetical protein